jgi:hypothetical protein
VEKNGRERQYETASDRSVRIREDRLKRPPVGVKFLFSRPPDIPQMAPDKSMSFCEMLKEA